MKRYFIGLLVLAFVFVLAPSCLVSAGDAPAQEITNAAREGMKSFLTPHRLDYLHDLGFDRQEDLDKAVLGEAFEIYTIPPEKLLDDSVPQDLETLVTSTNRWMFLILVDNQPKTIVTVGFINGKWEPVEFGGSGFAKVLSNFTQKWPASSGYRYRYVKVFQAGATFIEVYKNGKFVGIVPGTTLIEYVTGKAPKEYDPRNLIDPKKILPALRPAVKSNIETWK